jgi:hypothetical protein
MTKLMKECWFENATARLTALRYVKGSQDRPDHCSKVGKGSQATARLTILR